MDSDRAAIAAYLYVLSLDERDIAWEYLRRNEDYQRDWARCGDSDPTRWNLLAHEDPSLDARTAAPLWTTDTAALIVPAPASEAGCEPFDLWALPGPRHLVHDGRQLRASFGHGTARLRLSRAVRQGKPFAFLLPPSALAAELPPPAVLRPARRARAIPARRDALVRMRSLAAFDARNAGASHRDIAILLFGTDRVTRAWTQDGELRAQVRYLLARGGAMVAGGYRALLAPGGSREIAKPPS